MFHNLVILMSQNVIERVLQEARALKKKKSELEKYCDEEEKDHLTCKSCGKEGAIQLSLTDIDANNLQIGYKTKKTQLCHGCIDKFLTHPTKHLGPLEIVEREEPKKPMANLEEKRKAIAELDKEELSDRFDISEGYVSVVKRAIKEKVFNVLSDPSFTIDEKAKELDVEKSTISLYQTALKKVSITIENKNKQG